MIDLVIKVDEQAFYWIYTDLSLLQRNDDFIYQLGLACPREQ